jgi:hypothetical protein
MFPSKSADVGLKDHGMYIQYVDRIQIAASSRFYAFHVANAPNGAGKFMVTGHGGSVSSSRAEASGRSRDLHRAFIEGFRDEAEDSRAEAHVLIGDRNIKKDLGQHHHQIEHGKEGVSLT